MKKIVLPLLALSFMVLSCSKDSESKNSPEVEVFDINIEFQEHPAFGQTVAQVEGGNLEGVVFNLVTQDPIGALSIDQNTGEITVLDSTVFDYETRPSLSAVLTVNNDISSDQANLSISLIDIDEIEMLLGQSKEKYQSAENLSWVAISGSEYELLAESLSDVTRIGTTLEEYNTSLSLSNSSTNFTFAQSNASIPNNSYIFAFKYDNGSASSTLAQLKTSANINQGYTNFGPTLPEHGAGEQFFLLKGSDLLMASEAYLGFFNENSIRYYTSSNSTTTFFFEFGNMPYLYQYYTTFVARYQGLSTTVKQWK